MPIGVLSSYNNSYIYFNGLAIFFFCTKTIGKDGL